MENTKENTKEMTKINYQQQGLNDLTNWSREIEKNIYTEDSDFIHSIRFLFKEQYERLHTSLTSFGELVIKNLEPLVRENNLAENLPRLKPYDALGKRLDEVVHHPSYIAAGDIIYSSKLLERMSKPGGLSECLTFLFLSSQTGEAGHNCPIACSAGIIRVFQQLTNLPNKDFYLKKLLEPSFSQNYTGAQFLTEIQGGSDVGLNAVYANPYENNVFRIYGEKWFCSNANADLIFVTARYNKEISGTKGLALFLVPARWQNEKNHYIIHRLKDKLGTRSMATGEIAFQGAYAYLVGSIETGFHLAMDQVLHTSRIFNSVCVLAMARRAYMTANKYAKHRIAFKHPIYHYPLVKENLAQIKAENNAMLAGIFATAHLQDQFDKGNNKDENTKLLLRLLVNFQKYFTAKYSVDHIHHALDMLAGNGTIETFSSIPRLLRDCIICENWEGTHNVIRAQILKDLHKYNIDQIYLTFMRSEISKIEALKQLQTIVSRLDQFEKEIIEFKKRSQSVQALQIRFVVDDMAILYCATMLLKEAIHQQQTESNAKIKLSKFHCLDYFLELHVNKNIQYDESYLAQIEAITSID